MKQTEKKLLSQAPLKVLLIAALFLVSLFTFSFIIHEAVYEREDAFDAKSIRFFSAHSSPGFVKAMEYVSFFGSTAFLLPVYLLVVGWQVMKKNNRLAIDIAIIAISSTAMMFSLKEFFKRHRPQLPIIKDIGGYSFPSGHTMSSFIFCTILMYLVWKSNLTAGWKYCLILLLLLLTLTIGISRLVLNVHYATDVIGGFCLGIIWVILSFWILKKLRKKTPANGSMPA